MTITFRRLDPSDAEAFRTLRLTALATAPEAFGSSHEEESTWPLDVFRDRLSPAGRSAVFGAFSAGALVGMAGCLLNERVRTRHKALLWGVFVLPDHRRGGIGRRLVQQAIAHARTHAVLVQANVVTTNHVARRMYLGLGFVPYGIEPRALCVDGRFHDEALLSRDFTTG